MTVLADFVLPPGLEAREPPEAHGVPRDGVRMLVSRRRTGEITHHAFAELPGLLLPGDLLVVNTSGTLPAAVRISGQPGQGHVTESHGLLVPGGFRGVAPPGQLSVHFSTPLPESVVPAFRRLIAERLPSGRYRAADLMPAAAEAGVS